MYRLPVSCARFSFLLDKSCLVIRTEIVLQALLVDVFRSHVIINDPVVIIHMKFLMRSCYLLSMYRLYNTAIDMYVVNEYCQTLAGLNTSFLVTPRC